MDLFVFYSSLQLSRPIDQVFRFFSGASNLQRITPDWLQFQIKALLLITMRVGTRIEYRQNKLIENLGVPEDKQPD